MQKKIVLIDENEIIMSGLKTLFYHIDLYKVVQTFNFIVNGLYARYVIN